MSAQQTHNHTSKQLVPSANTQTTVSGYTTTSTNKLTGVNNMSAIKTTPTRILQLQEFARDNYEHGGHWIYECFDIADYQELLDYCNGNVSDAKAAMQERWERIAERQRECSFGDGEY